MTKLVLRGPLVCPPWSIHIGPIHLRPTYLDLLSLSKWTRHLYTLIRHLNILPLHYLFYHCLCFHITIVLSLG